MTLVRPADMGVLALAALLVGGSWAALWSEGGEGETVRITAPGVQPVVLALSQDRSVSIHGALGPSILEIRDGRVRFVDSPCIGRYCIHAGWLSRSGHVAACLPNGIVAEVIGSGQQFDAISF